MSEDPATRAQRLRILHLIPTLEGGGAERQLSLLVREQVRRGHTVRIGLRRRGVFAADAERAGVQLVALGDHRSMHPRLFASIGRALNDFAPDVVQTWAPQIDLCGGWMARRAGVPWILGERNSAGSYAQRSPFETARRWLARDAAMIVANSRVGADYWSRSAGPGVEVVANAVDVDAIRDAAASATIAPDETRPWVLSVGRLVESKGHGTVLDAWSRARPEAALRILGEGPLRDELTLRAERSHADVRLLGFVPDWWRLLGRACALVLMSDFEGAPNVVLEAMAARVPLIVSDIAAHRELLAPDAAQFVTPGDAQALATALQDVLADPAGRAARATLAARRVESMSPERCADAYDAIYARVLRIASTERAA